jgi:Tfp pilus assembly protein PilO
MNRNFPLIAAAWEHNRTRMMVIIGLLVCVSGAFVAQHWVAEPRLLALRTEQARLQQHVRQRQMEFNNSGIPVSVAERLEKNLQEFNRLIPEPSDFSVFLGDLFDWSQQAGLEIRQINFQPEVEKESGFLRYGLSFSVEGNYAQVKHFIHLLENARRILLVEQIALSGSATTGNGNHNVALRIKLATYFQEGPS